MQPVMFNNQQQYGGSGGAPAAPFPDLNFYSAGAGAGVGMGGMGGVDSGMGGGSFGGVSGGDFGGDLSGSMSGSGGMGSGMGGGGSPFDDEPPLLEELGINFKDIWSKTLAVSIPFRAMPTVHESQPPHCKDAPFESAAAATAAARPAMRSRARVDE